MEIWAHCRNSNTLHLFPTQRASRLESSWNNVCKKSYGNIKKPNGKYKG
ncbi:hypothetical protein HN789_06665 [archaeon]|jgi:hypothetical protein|nr:hypothetical protein [archaeon]MBT4022753.1 hypothetical protein [archaeon]MBT4273053.1 hypothetical protein [archaeon]MBT4461034.1 hypothetical protein [archaeon]MBT4858072.1 hypothetical protein [archaeon]